MLNLFGRIEVYYLVLGVADVRAKDEPQQFPHTPPNPNTPNPKLPQQKNEEQNLENPCQRTTKKPLRTPTPTPNPKT